MDKYSHQHHGGCECGAISLDYYCNMPLAELSARACQCSYCLPRKASYISVADSELHISATDRRYLYAHRFATASADFMHCVICNTAVYVKCTVEGQDYALVCAPVLEEFARLSHFDPVDYDGEMLAERMQRRSERWIPRLLLHFG